VVHERGLTVCLGRLAIVLDPLPGLDGEAGLFTVEALFQGDGLAQVARQCLQGPGRPLEGFRVLRRLQAIPGFIHAGKAHLRQARQHGVDTLAREDGGNIRHENKIRTHKPRFVKYLPT